MRQLLSHGEFERRARAADLVLRGIDRACACQMHTQRVEYEVHLLLAVPVTRFHVCTSMAFHGTREAQRVRDLCLVF